MARRNRDTPRAGTAVVGLAANAVIPTLSPQAWAIVHAALGIDPDSRMRRMEEAIDVMRLTTAQENASHEGEHNRFENITILPRPVQQPVPI